MTILILTLLLVVTVAVLVYPFWAARHGGVSLYDPASDLESGIRRARDRVYEEIRALQQEYFLANMTEAEYRAQLQSARQRAAELILQQRQVSETTAAIERRVDAELRALQSDDTTEEEA
ncbi:MAG: hypothetical protein OXL97_08165 [Chloroflexota bacterium]|nr:hypothetical protein [Chloroflexota bacterium]MDE2883853.1 hypothetical protein [Chloroflexota bacterium]